MSPASTEATLRIDLAACYRLVAHFGLDDLIYNHISARVPGTDDQFLINPHGRLFSEIRASAFVKIDLDGEAVEPTTRPVNQAGFVIHSAIHAYRPDAHCVLHTHSAAATAVSAPADGLPPLSQFAMRFPGFVGLHPYGGVALDLDERRRLLDNLASHNTLLVRKHGELTVGRTVLEAFILAYCFEEAARVQLVAQSAAAAGGGLVLAEPSVTVKAAQQLNRQEGDILAPGARGWPASLGLLDQIDPGFRN